MLTLVCRAYLFVLSGYHVLTGVISYCFPGFALSFYKALYGCDPIERRHLSLILKPWGALAICVGVAGLFAGYDPHRHVGVVAAILVLLVLRITYRLLCREQLRELSGISPRRNLISVSVIAAGAAILATWIIADVLL